VGCFWDYVIGEKRDTQITHVCFIFRSHHPI